MNALLFRTFLVSFFINRLLINKTPIRCKRDAAFKMLQIMFTCKSICHVHFATEICTIFYYTYLHRLLHIKFQTTHFRISIDERVANRQRASELVCGVCVCFAMLPICILVCIGCLSVKFAVNSSEQVYVMEAVDRIEQQSHMHKSLRVIKSVNWCQFHAPISSITSNHQ